MTTAEALAGTPATPVTWNVCVCPDVSGPTKPPTFSGAGRVSRMRVGEMGTNEVATTSPGAASGVVQHRAAAECHRYGGTDRCPSASPPAMPVSCG